MSQDPQAKENLRTAILQYPVGAEFSLDDLANATGYSPRSIGAYLKPQYSTFSQQKERMGKELGIEEKWLYKEDKYGTRQFVGKVLSRIQ